MPLTLKKNIITQKNYDVILIITNVLMVSTKKSNKIEKNRCSEHFQKTKMYFNKIR